MLGSISFHGLRSRVLNLINLTLNRLLQPTMALRTLPIQN